MVQKTWCELLKKLTEISVTYYTAYVANFMVDTVDFSALY